LTGTSILGPAIITTASGGTGEVDATSTTTYTNLVVQSYAPASITGVSGGTSSDPVMLPSSTIGSVSGDVGDPDGPSSVYFSFYWDHTGDFAASVGVPGAEDLVSPGPYEFVLCTGSVCTSPFESVTVDASNDYENELIGSDLSAGEYTIGIISEDSPDPMYSVVFETPVIGGSVSSSIPEPTTWAMLIVGFAGLTVFGYWSRAKTKKLAV
jgi:hypothetical protein